MNKKPEDTYENRALFMMMWSGSPSGRTAELFPDWYGSRMKLGSGSVDEVLWIADFCREAMERRERKSEGENNGIC